MFSPDFQFSLAVLQRKPAIADARTVASETLKHSRDEQGADDYSQRSQDASDGSASNWKPVMLHSTLYTMIYNTCYIQCYITSGGVIYQYIAPEYNILYTIWRVKVFLTRRGLFPVDKQHVPVQNQQYSRCTIAS